MFGGKWRLYYFAISLMIVKGRALGDDVLRQSRPRTGEFFNTSMNSPFMLEEFTTKHRSGTGSLLFKPHNIK